jgi:4-hydroxy-2-oxoheptanedioate aldolase
MTRLNTLIDLFESGQVAFGQLLPVGDYHLARRLGESDLDVVVLDFEHEGFNFTALGETLQWLLSRRRMMHSGSALARPTPLVRIPPNVSERNEWMTKQALDYGPFGLVTPHLSTAEDAAWLVSAVRYPQPPGAAIAEPQGHRGFWPGLAWRYWGCNTWEDYFPRADLWPLNPDGDLLLMPIVEEVEGWENIEEIVRVPGIGALWFGSGDGSVSLGNRPTDWDDPELVRYRDKVLEACKNARVVVGTSAQNSDQIKRFIDQGFQFIMASGLPTDQLAREGRQLAGREEAKQWAAQRLEDIPGF